MIPWLTDLESYVASLKRLGFREYVGALVGCNIPADMFKIDQTIAFTYVKISSTNMGRHYSWFRFLGGAYHGCGIDTPE